MGNTIFNKYPNFQYPINFLLPIISAPSDFCHFNFRPLLGQKSNISPPLTFVSSQTDKHFNTKFKLALFFAHPRGRWQTKFEGKREKVYKTNILG